VNLFAHEKGVSQLPPGGAGGLVLSQTEADVALDQEVEMRFEFAPRVLIEALPG
jgi:hypothetical protein